MTVDQILSDLSELDRLRRVNAELVGALEQIAKGEGEFSRDPLTHAENTIDAMKALAMTALMHALKSSET